MQVYFWIFLGKCGFPYKRVRKSALSAYNRAMENFPEAMREAMKRLAINQAEVARRSGATKETVGLILKGKSGHAATFRGMAQAVGYDTAQELIKAWQRGQVEPFNGVAETPASYGMGSIHAAIAAETGVNEAQVRLVLGALARRIVA